MPLSSAEKAQLQQDIATVIAANDVLKSQIDVLVVDTVDVPALQAQLAAVTAERDALVVERNALAAKIAAAQAALA